MDANGKLRISDKVSCRVLFIVHIFIDTHRASMDVSARAPYFRCKLTLIFNFVFEFRFHFSRSSQTTTERERFKDELAQKLVDKDPTVKLMEPDKASKSYAWLADCFLLIYHNNVKQNFVYCKVCNNLVTYNSIHGTGSLLRHNCYRKKVNANSPVPMHPNIAMRKMIGTAPKRLDDAKTLQSAMAANEGENVDRKSTPFKAEVRNVKQTIQQMINRGDPAIELKLPANIKSDVWNMGNFRIIYKNKEKLEFVLCLFCNSLITYRSKTGTASLLRHSCTKRMSNQPKSEPSMALIDEDEIETIPVSDIEHPDEAYQTSVDVGSTSYENVVLTSDYPEEFKEEALRLLQCFALRDMQAGNLLQKRGFLNFGQYLINIGAEYGKVNIENIFADESWWSSQMAEYTKLSGILKKMLKGKLDEQKFALSCDYWNDPNRKTNFLTLYGHYIDDQFEMRKVNLGTTSFTTDYSDFTEYKHLLVSIMEIYFGNEIEAELFLSKCTIVIFDETHDPLKTFSTIQCSCLILNRIAQQLISESNGTELVPNHIIATGNWSNVWDYLESNNTTPEAKSLLLLLDPFAEAVKSLSSDMKPTINEVYIFRKKLVDQFKSANVIGNERIRNVAQTLIEQLFPITNIHQIAVFLDPRFKSLKFMDHEERSSVIKMVTKMISSTDDGNDESNAQKNAFGANTSQSSNCLDSSKYLLEYMDVSDERNDKNEEIDTYINMKLSDVSSANILEFWESRYDLPCLRQLAKDILSIPAAAVVSEKIFSEEANLFVRRRLNMEIDNVDRMLYIHENFDLLDNIL